MGGGAASGKRRRTNTRSGGFLDIETKFLDTGLLASTITAPTDASGGEHDPATTNCLNPIGQGDGESQRDGRKCVMKNVFVTGSVNGSTLTDQADAVSNCTVHIALVLDTQTNATQLSSEQVFKNPMADARSAAYVLRNKQYTSRFQVLDRVTLTTPMQTMSTDAANTTTIAGYKVPFKLGKKINIPVFFSNTTGNVSTITDNSLHIIAYADNVESTPKLTYNSRVNFEG